MNTFSVIPSPKVSPIAFQVYLYPSTHCVLHKLVYKYTSIQRCCANIEVSPISFQSSLMFCTISNWQLNTNCTAIWFCSVVWPFVMLWIGLCTLHRAPIDSMLICNASWTVNSFSILVELFATFAELQIVCQFLLNNLQRSLNCK